LKCIGSRQGIASDIASVINCLIFTEHIEYYYEPFVGGANIVDKVQANKRIASDIDKGLIELYQRLQSGFIIPDKITIEQYFDSLAHYKAKDKSYQDWMYKFVGLMTSTNGKLFDHGKIKNDKQLDKIYNDNKNELEKQMINLTDVEFRHCDYNDIIESIKEKALIYCDIPDDKKFNTVDFWNKIRKSGKNNIVIISAKQAPDDFKILWESDYRQDADKLFSI
jgi:DNA adenine methylase